MRSTAAAGTGTSDFFRRSVLFETIHRICVFAGIFKKCSHEYFALLGICNLREKIFAHGVFLIYAFRLFYNMKTKRMQVLFKYAEKC